MIVNLNPNIIFSAKLLIREGNENQKMDAIIDFQVMLSISELTGNQSIDLLTELGPWENIKFDNFQIAEDHR